MDKRIRKNEICVINLPRCDYVFSSTRSCFIAYGFNASPLEMEVLSGLLRERGIEPVEAGGRLAPGQNVFCAKICSKIIVSQFCIVLANNSKASEGEAPNANVLIEYGLMLGFNKYVIPFQLESQQLPFNVAGLDTIKYNPTNLKAKAAAAIDQAIKETEQDKAASPPLDQVLDAFILAKGALVVSLISEGDRNLYDLGRALGYNLLTDFSGMNYIYLGNFTHLRSEAIIWRLKTLQRILEEREGSFDDRVSSGLLTREASEAAKRLWKNLKIWLVVTSEQEKVVVSDVLRQMPPRYSTEVYSVDDVQLELLAVNNIKVPKEVRKSVSKI